MTGTVTGGGRKEQETLGINQAIKGSIDGVKVEVRGMTHGFYVRRLPGLAGEADTSYLPGEELFLDDTTRILATSPPEYELTQYDQAK